MSSLVAAKDRDGELLTPSASEGNKATLEARWVHWHCTSIVSRLQPTSTSEANMVQDKTFKAGFLVSTSESSDMWQTVEPGHGSKAPIKVAAAPLPHPATSETEKGMGLKCVSGGIGTKIYQNQSSVDIFRS